MTTQRERRAEHEPEEELHARLRASEERHRRVLDALPVLVAYCDDQVVYRFCNAAYERWFGIRPEELVGRPVRDVLGEEAFAAVEPHVKRVLAGQRASFDARLPYRSGGERDVHVEYVPDLAEDGAVRGYHAMVEDVTDRRRSESLSRHLAAIVEGSDDAILGKDLEGRITSWNSGCERMYGFGAEEMIGRNVSVIVPPERRLELEGIMSRLAAGEGVRQLETVRRRKDGSTLLVSLTISPIRDADGSVVGGSTVARDVTETRGAQRRLEESAARQTFALGASGMGAWDSDLRTHETVWTEGHFALLGYQVDEVTPSWENWIARVHPDDRERVTTRAREALERREPYRCEYRVVWPDGSVRWLDARGEYWYDADERPYRMYGVLTDVTGRRAAAEELERARTWSQQLVEASPDIIALYDVRRDRNVYVTGALEALLGYTPEELRGLGPRLSEALIHPEDAQDMRSFYLGFDQAAPAEVRETTYRARHRDGSWRWMNVRAVAFARDADGTTREVLVVSRDVTEVVRAQEELRLADRRKDQFLAILGHELRNPLAALDAGLRVLRTRLDHPEDRDWAVQMMGEQIEQLVKLLNDLLDRTRIARGTLKLSKRALDLASVVERVVTTLSSQIAERGHELTVDVPPKLAVEGDPVRMEQVLGNLLNNAARYTPPGGHLEVRARRDGDWVRAEVRDDGQGLAPEELERIFEPFAQGAATSGGLGVGLTLARQLAELHGGRIEVESAGPGQGSAFTLVLPATGKRPRRRRRVSAAGDGQAAGLDVLVVDDNVDAGRGLALLVEQAGGSVRLAATGAAALAEAERRRPDVVLLDLGLPDISGYEVARELGRHGDGPQVIGVTGYGHDDARLRSREVGIGDHLLKPIDPARMLSLLDRLRRAKAGGPDDSSDDRTPPA